MEVDHVFEDAAPESLGVGLEDADVGADELEVAEAGGDFGELAMGDFDIVVQ